MDYISILGGLIRNPSVSNGALWRGFHQSQGGPGFGSVRLRFRDGTVRAVPVFGSGSVPLRRGFFCVSVQFHRKERFRFRFRFLGHPVILWIPQKSRKIPCRKSNKFADELLQVRRENNFESCTFSPLNP